MRVSCLAFLVAIILALPPAPSALVAAPAAEARLSCATELCHRGGSAQVQSLFFSRSLQRPSGEPTQRSELFFCPSIAPLTLSAAKSELSKSDSYRIEFFPYYINHPSLAPPKA